MRNKSGDDFRRTGTPDIFFKVIIDDIFDNPAGFLISEVIRTADIKFCASRTGNEFDCNGISALFQPGSSQMIGNTHFPFSVAGTSRINDDFAVDKDLHPAVGTGTDGKFSDTGGVDFIEQPGTFIFSV